MPLFQPNIVSQYIATLNSEKVAQAYDVYKAYFLNPEIQKNIRQSNEVQFQEGFLRELFVNVLGYTINPSPNFNLRTEEDNETDSKKADGAILINNEVVGVIELKGCNTTDLKKVEAQAFGYKNQHAKATYVIISNFEKLRFYIDNSVNFEEFNLFNLSESQFALLYLCLAYENIEKNLPKTVKAKSLSKEEEITNKLYKDYSEFKQVLFNDILALNHVESAEQKIVLFKKTQKLLDRLLFIFFAEDSGLLTPNTMRIHILDVWQKMKEVGEEQPLYNRIKKYFTWLDEGFKSTAIEVFAYNGGLFKPDEVLDSLIISDELLYNYTLKLSEYNYASEVDVNILGHIFEHSLTEIEEVTNSLLGNEQPTVSKRKKDGVFYTPQYITKYIVENTVGKLCAEKKAEMDIDEEEYFSDKKRQKNTKKALFDKLNDYREWLLGVTICDPACGSGAFLNAALKYLINEHKLIDEMQAKITGDAIVFPNIENVILENNLYGVDINEESVEIAKLALWLRTAQPYRKLSSLNNNIKCGNSLISDVEVAGDKAFNWEAEFPQVFEKGGFDVVIGNPPYVDSETMTKTIPLQREYIANNYDCAKGNWDLLIPFIEKGFNILQPYGKLAFITSNKWLALDYGSSTRNFVVPNLNFLVDCTSEKVFESANVSSVVFGLQKTECKDMMIGDVKNAEIQELYTLSKQPIETLIRFNLSLAFSKGIGLIKKLESLKKISQYDYSVFGSFTTAEAYLLVPFVEDKEQVSANDFKLINTGTIDKYLPLWGFSQIKYLGKQAQYPIVNRGVFQKEFPNRYEKLSKPKVIITGIRYFEAIIDKDNSFLPAKSTVTITGDLNNLYFLLAVLNSKVIAYYIRENYYSSSMGGGINFTPDLIRSLPIPQIPTNKQLFVEYSEQMQKCNQSLLLKRCRFMQRLKDNVPNVKINSTLETFDLFDFTKFITELKKQKIVLSLREQDEWEDFFNDYKQQCNELSAQISATDREIDKMVYELYGLTDEEIAIVEGMH
ncbi:MAG: N-6 DNA methylase [Alistipes sp.]|nr:N-6 DNA methylase [Alistipes sp.]